MNLTDKNLEVSILSCCLMDQVAANKTVVDITEDHFYFYKPVFNTIKDMVRKSEAIDINTLNNRLPYDDKVKFEILQTLSSAQVTTVYLESYLKAIKELKHRGDILTYAEKLKRAVSEEYNALIDKLTDIPQVESTTQKHVHTKNIMQNVVNDMAERVNSKSDLRGLTTSFKDLDNLTGGMKKGEIILIEADPNVGKSIIAMNIGMRLATKGHRVDYFSYEMTTEQLGYRMAPALFNLPIKKISLPKDNIGEKELKQIAEYNNPSLFENFNIYAEELTTRTVEEIKFKVKDATLKTNKTTKLIIIDYLQLLKGDGDEWERAGNNVQLIKRYATELGIPIILIVSKAKDGTVRGSGQITFDADQRWSLEREHDSESKEERMDTTLKILKNRDGGKGKIKMLFLEAFLKFEEVDRRWKY